VFNFILRTKCEAEEHRVKIVNLEAMDCTTVTGLTELGPLGLLQPHY